MAGADRKFYCKPISQTHGGKVHVEAGSILIGKNACAVARVHSTIGISFKMPNLSSRAHRTTPPFSRRAEVSLRLEDRGGFAGVARALRSRGDVRRRVRSGGVDWQACISSDLPRARITASAVFRGEIAHTDLLREPQFAPFK